MTKQLGNYAMPVPHIAAVALYGSGLGLRAVCRRLRIPAERRHNLRSIINECGGVDRKRRGVTRTTLDYFGTTNELDQVRLMERAHSRWWASLATRLAAKERDSAPGYWREAHDRMKATPHLRIKFYLRKRLRHAAIDKQYSLRTTELIGCTPQFLRDHLEAQFTPGMSWDTYGTRGWHIDHKIPCASFNLLDQEQAKKCFHFTNLRPLWASENISKGDKILPEFAHLAA